MLLGPCTYKDAPEVLPSAADSMSSQFTLWKHRFKQRGKEAEAACNVFYHLTYEGAVDLDRIEDPTQLKVCLHCVVDRTRSARHCVVSSITCHSVCPHPWSVHHAISIASTVSPAAAKSAKVLRIEPPCCVCTGSHGRC